MPPKTAYHHGDLRTALVEEAAAMIAEGGTASVTMREIGARLGVSRAAPYNHFSDRAALLTEVAASGFEQLRERLESVEAAGAGAGEAELHELGAAYVRFAVENPAHYRMMYGREALQRREVPALKDAADGLYEFLVGVIEAHQESGLLARGDSRTQAYMAWSAAHGLASLWTEGHILATDDIEGLTRAMTRTVLRGLGMAARDDA